MKGRKESLDPVKYKEDLEKVEKQKDSVKKEKELEEAEKKKRILAEKKKLRKVFTAERCGEQNMYCVNSLIDRAAFLRVELESIEERLRAEGCMELFTQGTQSMWRENPLSKIHVNHSKSYRETLKQLESYSVGGETAEDKGNPVVSLICRANEIRSKYQR